MAARFLTIFLVLILYICEASSNPTIKIEQGVLQGTVGTSRLGRPFYKFLGIPYGQVVQRFADSFPAQGWTGTRDARQFREYCLQQFLGGEENCLHLNIYTPQLPSNDKTQKSLPVLFFIHDGGFLIGTGNSYGAEYFMDEDCVLVTINYRLDIFGFLSFDTEDAPGNQGLKDQVLALQWVQLNIHRFNGNKDKVTIFGSSSGGASVSFLMLSPLSKGLFHSAISQSGAAHPECAWTFNRDIITESYALAKFFNCTGNKAQILNCLRIINAHEILAALYPLEEPEETASFPTIFNFLPSLETRPVTPNSLIFLSKLPLDIYQEGSFQNVPWIVGANKYEGFVFGSIYGFENSRTPEELSELWNKFGPEALEIQSRVDKEDIIKRAAHVYLDGHIHFKENITNLLSDRLIISCVKMAAQLHAKKAPVYLYILDKTGGFSTSSMITYGRPPPGPTHGDEMTYQFKLTSHILGESHGGDIEKQDELFGFSQDFVKMWVDFAETGKPREMWNSKKIVWEPLDNNQVVEGKWLHLDTDAKMESEDITFQARLKFWTDLKLWK